MGNREIVRMPDSPATSFFQLSSLPVPSEVMMPMPVMATTGRPALSLYSAMFASLNLLDQGKPFAAPVADAGDRDLRDFLRRLTRVARAAGREELSLPQSLARDRDIRQELRVETMTDMGAGGANRKADLRERRFFGGSRRLQARSARDHNCFIFLHLRLDRGPLACDGRLDFARLPAVTVGLH